MESVGMMKLDLSFYKGKKVLITGHTGFKGSWLSFILHKYGADVVGYSLEPPTKPSLFEIARIGEKITSYIGDIRDFDHLLEVFKSERPEVVFHLAAQPIVRTSYEQPVQTYETNVMGTVNLLECCRLTSSVKSVVNITTDKVYKNNEWMWGYREDEELDGYEPYSNSKSCSELITACYKRSFFNELGIPVSTARAGNVIGGGDFSKDRIIPDCVRGAIAGKTIVLRNPNSIRPYQHVLEPLFAYLFIASAQYYDQSLASSYNIGPNESDCATTKRVASLFCDNWEGASCESASSSTGPHEANYLRLDNSKARAVLELSPCMDVECAIKETVQWYLAYYDKKDMVDEMEREVERFISNCPFVCIGP